MKSHGLEIHFKLSVLSAVDNTRGGVGVDLTSCTNDFNSLIRKSLSEQREYRNAGVKMGMDFLGFSPHLLYLFNIFYI